MFGYKLKFMAKFKMEKHSQGSLISRECINSFKIEKQNWKVGFCEELSREKEGKKMRNCERPR